MNIEEKFFPEDRNYLLKTVQAFSKEILLNDWTREIFSAYNRINNPMGLEDDFVLALKKKIFRSKDLLSEVYDVLAAVYRMLNDDNQLEFRWDGRSHMEHYDEEWKPVYAEWIVTLSGLKEVQRPVIKYATQGEGFNHDFLKNTIRRAVLSYFKCRLRGKRLQRIAA